MNTGEPGLVTASGAIHRAALCVLAAATVACLVGCAQKVVTTSSSISATYDQSGEHPATAMVKGVATVSCSDGAGNQGAPVDCLILAPGYMGEVALHKSVQTSGAGEVQLSCSGQGRCSAVVVQ
jgi:hypothetical protein